MLCSRTSLQGDRVLGPFKGISEPFRRGSGLSATTPASLFRQHPVCATTALYTTYPPALWELTARILSANFACHTCYPSALYTPTIRFVQTNVCHLEARPQYSHNTHKRVLYKLIDPYYGSYSPAQYRLTVRILRAIRPYLYTFT